MRRDKAAARILLILSFVHVAAAAPAIIQQRSLEVTMDVTPTSEKRENADESSHPFQQTDNNLPSTSGTLPSQGVTSPAPGDPQLHSNPPPELGSPQLHNDQQPTPGALTSQDDTASASKDPQLHDDELPWWQKSSWRPSGETHTGESSGTKEIPPLHDDLSGQHTKLYPIKEMPLDDSSVVWQSDDSSLPSDPSGQHTNWPGSLEKSSASSAFSDTSESSASSKAPQLHNDPPTAFGSPEVYHYPPSPFGSQQLHDVGPEGFGSSGSHRLHSSIGAASPSPDWYSAPPPLHAETPPPLDSETPRPLVLPTPPSDPETHRFFNDAMKTKLMVTAGVGALAGSAVLFAIGIKTLINSHSHGSQPAGKDPASSGVVSRGASMRNEDLRLLSILTRRALERLD